MSTVLTQQAEIVTGDAAVTFDEMKAGSYYTITGVGGELSEWVEAITKCLDNSGIGKPKGFVKFSGKAMNDYYELVDSNRYSDDLTFLAFPLDGLHIGKLAMFKMQHGDRWFDDIVDNNTRRNNQLRGIDDEED